MHTLLGYILTYSYIILIIFIACLIEKYCHLKEEIPRKIIHIFVGFSWFIMTYFFKNTIHLIIIPASFLIINYLSFTKHLIKPMERIKSNTPGTVYYAFSYTILAFLTYIHHDFLPYYGIGVLVMSIGDGLSPLISLKFKKRIGNTYKTYAGFLWIMFSTLIITILFSYYFKLDFTILKYIILTISSGLLELIGNKGKDNLSLPVGLAILGYMI